MEGTKNNFVPPQDVDSQKLWTLIINHEVMLFRICKKYTKSNHDAEDAYSQIKIKLYTTLQKGKVSQSEIQCMSGWMATVTRNFCIDIYRKNQKDEYKFDQNSSSLEFASAEKDRPEAQVMRLQAKKIAIAIQDLPQNLRDVAIRRLLLDASFNEISVDLGIQTCNARKRYQSATALLHQSLGIKL